MQNNRNQMIQVNHLVLGKTIIIGFFGGIFLSAFFAVIHYFNIVEVNIFHPWKVLFTQYDLPIKWYIYPICIIFYGTLSIPIAFVYYFIGKNRNHWGIGALYGLFLAVVTYIFLPILLFDQHFLQNYLLKTHISFFVLFIIYGVFIGYSISYESARLQKERTYREIISMELILIFYFFTLIKGFIYVYLFPIEK